MRLSLTQQQMRTARQSRDRRFDGLFYVGVLTTGIFCRPICSVKMANESNVSYYANAAQAIDAGYRPCKVCKPDSAPHTKHSPADRHIVERAVSILHSTPGAHLETLSQQLSTSSRNLRKQFHNALGLSPSHYQRSVQLLFAKQLLQQTRLTIMDIAVAAGFHSSRSLQQAFKQAFNMTPTEFRRTEDEAPPVDTQLFLSYRPPYLWEPLQTFLATRSIAGIEAVDEHSYTRQFVIDNQPGKVTAVHKPEKHGFDVHIAVHRPEHIKPVLARLSRVLDCDADWLSIETSLDAAGFAVTDSTRGIRIPGVWDIFESGCRAILGQQVSVAAAINKTKQLVEQVRAVDDCVGFPSPAQVTPEIVEQLGMPNARKQTLIRYAQFMQDSDNRQAVESGSVEGLLALKGIGPWTCQYILMRGISHPDIWMAKDLAILRQCEKYALNPDAAKPWSSYLTLALWHDYMENN